MYALKSRTMPIYGQVLRIEEVLQRFLIVVVSFCRIKWNFSNRFHYCFRIPILGMKRWAFTSNIFEFLYTQGTNSSGRTMELKIRTKSRYKCSSRGNLTIVSASSRLESIQLVFYFSGKEINWCSLSLLIISEMYGIVS